MDVFNPFRQLSSRPDHGRVVMSCLENGEVHLPPATLSVKYVAEGEEIFVFGDQAIRVEAGQFLLVDARTACLAQARRGRPAVGLCVYLPPSSPGKEPEVIPSVFERMDSPALLQPAGLSTLGALLSEQAHLRRDRIGADVIHEPGLVADVQAGLQALAMDLDLRLDRLDDLRASTRAEMLVRLEQARARMHDSLTDVIGLDALASEAGMSRFHFVRRFSRTYGQSPVAYHSDLRLRHAAADIERGEITPSAACDRLGYSDMRAFRRAYKRAVGRPPRRLFPA